MIGLARAKPYPLGYVLHKISGFINNSNFTARGGGGISLTLSPSINQVIRGMINSIKLAAITKLANTYGTFVAVRREPGNRVSDVL